ncbi:MAG: polyprenyl synthetase family protein [Polyangiaceae bacterium]
MTNTALVLDHKPLILEVLSEHFSEASLERTLGLGEERVPWRVWDEALYGPLSDFLSRPGKEFRGRLVSMAWELAGQKSSPPPELALVVEVLHAGSLIVDDIEDDSSYRRGELALHKKWGLPRALNAGSWLYFWPDALLERMQLAPPIELGVRRAIDRTLLSAHHGQALDLSTRVFDLTQSEVPDVVSVTTRLKTGMLMQLAASLGAIAAGGPRQVTQALARFGMKLGAGLQMLDDLGGIVSVERCHKGHEDLTSARPTWLFAWAAEELDRTAYQRLRRRSEEVAKRELHPEALAEELRDRVGGVGRERISAHLRSAFEELGSVFGDAPALVDVKAEIELLGRSYG